MHSVRLFYRFPNFWLIYCDFHSTEVVFKFLIDTWSTFGFHLVFRATLNSISSPILPMTAIHCYHLVPTISKMSLLSLPITVITITIIIIIIISHTVIQSNSPFPHPSTLRMPLCLGVFPFSLLKSFSTCSPPSHLLLSFRQ